MAISRRFSHDTSIGRRPAAPRQAGPRDARPCHAGPRKAALALCITLWILLGACAPAPSASSHATAKAPVTIKIGSYLWPGEYWVDIAWKKGWFAEEGLQVQRFDVNLKYFESLDDVASGRLDVMGFSQFDLVRHVAAGHDLVGVAAIDYSIGAEALIGHLDIHRLQDLKGKRLSLRRGTYLEYLLAIVAEREGFDLSSVTLIDQAGQAALDDFKAGRVDAILVWEPYVSQAVAAGGNTLFSAADFPGLTYSVLSLRREFIQQHREEVAALLRVWRRGQIFVRDHPAEACVIVSELTGNTLADTRDLLRTVRVLNLADNSRAFSYAAGFESLHGSWRRMNDFMLDRGLVSARVDSPSHLDSGFIRQLD